MIQLENKLVRSLALALLLGSNLASAQTFTPLQPVTRPTTTLTGNDNFLRIDPSERTLQRPGEQAWPGVVVVLAVAAYAVLTAAGDQPVLGGSVLRPTGSGAAERLRLGVYDR